MGERSEARTVGGAVARGTQGARAPQSSQPANPAPFARPDAEERSPKQERSRITRDSLLSATIEMLAGSGWPVTTVGAVAERAGVSRGAAQHHFPTREDLMIAALEDMVIKRSAQLDETFGTERPDTEPERTRSVVRHISEHFTGDLFKAALQVWTAASADPALRARIVPSEAQLSRHLYDLVATTLRADMSDQRTRRMIRATLDLARGLGLAEVLIDDAARRVGELDAWAEELVTIKRLP
ncbi:TetR/AcrR family transcriptional regulator [Dietzia sp.]|uniref:TetR/AcrR family transcriptional regulator n=1 Tax=Dietzia sp. TaxID=1871616 RepID=UPI002FDB7C1D